MKRALCAVFALSLLFLFSCSSPAAKARYYTTFEYFDTVTDVIGYEADEAVFDEVCRRVDAELARYHRLTDIYHEYSGLDNLCTVNRMAGREPVAVCDDLLDLCEAMIAAYDLTGGRVIGTMGAVLSLWHDCRTSALEDPAVARLPDGAALKEAAAHIDPSVLVIDRAAGTVYLTDPAASLDVGAFAKGFAAERIARMLEADGISGYALNLGGNLRVIGTRGDGRPFVAGIQDPDGETGRYRNTVSLTDGFTTLVTSGSYQRTFTVDGVSYPHIIDPSTLFPARTFTSVSILADDSALADALSTALFCMTQEEGEALIETLDHCEAMWIAADGSSVMTAGFAAHINEP